MEVEPITLPESPIKPSKPFFALLLSFVLPGVGQVYNGQIKKGILLLAILLFGLLFLGFSRLVLTYYGLILTLLFELLLRLYAMIDAFMVARKNKGQRDSIAPMYVCFIIAVMLAVPLSLKTDWLLGIRAFRVMTTSGEPVLKMGDDFIVDTRAYKNEGPQCGDLVVYRDTVDKLLYYSRVIGTPGDKLELNKDIPTINGKPSDAAVLSEHSGDEFSVYSDNMVELFQETLPGGHMHFGYRLKVPVDSTKANVKNIVVPEGSYYLMSDNRDYALDSRYKGFIKRENIIGRLIFCYWSKDITRISRNFRYQ